MRRIVRGLSEDRLERVNDTQEPLIYLVETSGFEPPTS